MISTLNQRATLFCAGTFALVTTGCSTLFGGQTVDVNQYQSVEAMIEQELTNEELVHFYHRNEIADLSVAKARRPHQALEKYCSTQDHGSFKQVNKGDLYYNPSDINDYLGLFTCETPHSSWTARVKVRPYQGDVKAWKLSQHISAELVPTPSSASTQVRNQTREPAPSLRRELGPIKGYFEFHPELTITELLDTKIANSEGFDRFFWAIESNVRCLVVFDIADNTPHDWKRSIRTMTAIAVQKIHSEARGRGAPDLSDWTQDDLENSIRPKIAGWSSEIIPHYEQIHYTQDEFDKCQALASGYSRALKAPSYSRE